MRRAVLARWLIAAAALAWPASAAFAQDASGPRSHYVRQDPDRRIVIIFVHGGAGSAAGTWKNSAADKSWPEMMVGDQAFRGASVFVYNYESPWFRKALSIHELGVEMRSVLRDRGVLDHEELAFVAHSLGGLVVKAFLLTFREYVKKTRSLYFFGVPSKGTELTRVARYLSDNPQSGEVVSVEVGSYLEKQLIDWRTLNSPAPRFPIYCAYEMLPAPIYGSIVVDFSSAIEGCYEAPEAILADHRQMVKPQNRETTAYVLLRDKFKALSARQYPVNHEARQIAAEFLTKGLAAASQGNYLGAIEMYHLSVKADQGYERAYFWRGQAFATVGSINRALDDLKKALELGLDDPVDQALAQRLVDRLGPTVATGPPHSNSGAGSGRVIGMLGAFSGARSIAPPASTVFDGTKLIDQLFSDDPGTRVRATSQVVVLGEDEKKLDPLPELLDRAGGATADLGVTLNVLAVVHALPAPRATRHRDAILRYLEVAQAAGPQAADFVTLIGSTLGR